MIPNDILRQYWGYSSFRPLQEEIIKSVLQDKDTMALLPTGAGKSICYQVPALARDGFTLVISPLIALMKDQVTRLKEHDIMSTCIHAGMNYHEVKTCIENMLYGPYKLLYVSPERLQTELFREYLPSFNLNLIAIDEAHCISQWGHDFRPDYLKIADLRTVFPDVPLLALTASATIEVQQDIANQLQLNQPAIFRQSVERSNLLYQVKYSENKAMDVREHLPANDSSIIYCRSRKQTEMLAKQLQQQGIPAINYHAGMQKDKREEAQIAWMQNEVKAIAATTAFGMGIDKADVRMVLHYDSPEHLEGYYQEAGRAGRDGQPSKTLLLYNASDINRLRENVAVQFPNEAYLRQVYQSVNEYLQIPISAQPDRYFPFDLADFCKRFELEASPASYALRLLAQEGLWTISEAVFHPASIQFITDRHTLDQVAATYPDLGYVTTGLLRLYGTIFHYPTTIRVSAVAYQLKLNKELLEQILQQLHKMEVLEYHKPGEGPQLYFHHFRVDSRHLIIDMQRIARLRAQHEARTEAMIQFLQNEKTCRGKILKNYFGEQTEEDCGHCDICLRNKTALAQAINTLYKELPAKVKSIGPVSLSQLMRAYPVNVHDDVISTLRKLADESILLINESNIISVLPASPAK